MKALFLSHQHALSNGGGGQQQCTREYHDTLRAAGFELHDVTFDTDQLWVTRLRRKFLPAPYENLVPREFFSKVDQALSEIRPAFVFCNLHDCVPIAPRLRRALPAETKLVLLSHGLASVDEAHAVRIARAGIGIGSWPHHPDSWLAEMLRIERTCLPFFDHVFTLAAFEVEVTQRLGARSVSWLPRTLGKRTQLDWKPMGDRVGCIGTFDHPPNLEGLELVCAALKRLNLPAPRLRVITRSRAVLAHLCARYSFVDDLGPMEKPGEAESEAATWSAFLHPIFCFAMGCSTKLATGMDWALPVLTTTPGTRGYEWREGGVAIADEPQVFAQNILKVLDHKHAKLLRGEVLRVVGSAPSINEVAARMRRDIYQ